MSPPVSTAEGSRFGWGNRIIVGLFLGCVALIVLFVSMSKPINHDEHMYCTAGVLLSQGSQIYRDFNYPSQLPYHPLLLASFYRLLGTDHYLLYARLVSVTADMVTLVVILLIYQFVFQKQPRRGWFLGMMAVIWILFNPTVNYASGWAWNHDLVIAATLLSYWIFLRLPTTGPVTWHVTTIVGLMTWTTWMRVTTVLPMGLMLFFLWLKVRGSSPPRRVCGIILGTMAAVSAWPFWIIAQAPRAFALNLFFIPRLYGNWLHEMGQVHSKIQLTWACLTEPVMFMTLVLCAVAWGLAYKQKSKFANVMFTLNESFILALPAVFVVIAFIPPTMWDQYWAVPVPFLAAGCAFPLRVLWDYCERQKRIRIMLVALLLPTLFITLINPVPWLGLLFSFRPQTWLPIRIHQVARQINTVLEPGQRVLTLGPLWALEGGYDIYPELACGSIVYRIADQLTDDQRHLTHSVGPESLSSLIASFPPPAILVDIEKSAFAFLEDPLREQAPTHWISFDFSPGPLVLTAHNSSLNKP